MRPRPLLLLCSLLCILILAACAPAAVDAPATPTAAVALIPTAAGVPPTAEPPTPTPPPTASPTATPTATATPLPTNTATPSPTPTPDPYAGLTIDDLSSRAYSSTLHVEQTLHVTGAFTRTLVRYNSDGLDIYGFMNVPFGEGPFPVALVLHGYIPPENYGTIAYTTRYADALARAGYLVVHPNYRNHPPSDTTAAFEGGRQTHDFRVGYAIDVLHLIAAVQAQGGQPGPLAQARPDAIYLLGHSMGGGIALRIITVNPSVRAAVLYGSMSGDEYQNYERILVWSDGEVGEEELATAPGDMARIAPIHYLNRIESAVSIHHGLADTVVPPEWSAELCEQLRALGKEVECFTYPGAPHTFQGETDRLFQRRVIDFFNRQEEKP